MNHLIEKTVVVQYDIANPEDRFTLISEYVKEGHEFTVEYDIQKDDNGLRRRFVATLQRDGVAIAQFEGDGYAVGIVPEEFVTLYNRAVTDGLEAIRPMPEAEVAKAKKSKAITSGGATRGAVSQAQKDEIAAMSREGMTAKEISAQVGRSEETVTKYMAVVNVAPIGPIAESEETEVEDFEGAEDALEAEDEEEAVVLS